MVASYYQGDSVPMEFTVSYKSEGVTPSYAKVHIQDPYGTIYEMDDATIDSSTVSFIVPPTHTIAIGSYKVEFRLGMSYGERTHFREFHISSNIS